MPLSNGDESLGGYMQQHTNPQIFHPYPHLNNQSHHFLYESSADSVLVEIPELRHQNEHQHHSHNRSYFSSQVSKFADPDFSILHNHGGENDVTNLFGQSDPNFDQSQKRHPHSQTKSHVGEKMSNCVSGTSGKVARKSRRSNSPTALIKELTGSASPLTSIDEIDKRYLANLSREERRRIRRATVKYRTAHASRERLRVEAFSIAFTELRKLLPTLPHDKKLSKIEILRLAIAYISYLDHLLASTS